jgi:predicted metal-binding protein
MFRPDASDRVPAVDSETPPGPKPGPVLISVCISCRAKDNGSCSGNELIAALRAELRDAVDVAVRPVQCLSVCKRPATVAVNAPDGYTFLFGDLDASSGAAALAQFVRSYRATDYGFVPWRERPEMLRRGLVARLPPAAWSPDDGRPPA